MRNLKKILALVLALMMALSVMVFASAANYDDYSDKDQISEEYAEAVEVLTGMDIFWGSENSFYPKENVSRAEVATLLYRIMTTDVSGSQVGIYKDYGMFDDVLETNWFAGYVNFAANSEYVVGVGDGKFNPEGDVTGYEWITMLLRAVGYDANGEISGSEWKITAARLAKQAGILGDFNEATLSSALTREQVAYLLFNAIQVEKVEYTPALGYQDAWGETTIGQDEFGLAKGALTSIDEWGRPGYRWTNGATKVYATIESEPVYTNTVAVTECDLSTALGLEEDVNVVTYTNGENNETENVNVEPTDRRSLMGGQGTVMEVYSVVDYNAAGSGVDNHDGYIVVYIDTYLAEVVKVDDATFDSAGHLRTPATLYLKVYDGRTPNSYVVEYNGDVNYTYSVGDMLLVNAVAKTDAHTTSLLSTSPVATFNGNSYYTADHMEILDVASGIVGTQTIIWTDLDQHTVNGETKPDAAQYNHDAAGKTANKQFVWYFDQFGNFIGSFDYKTITSYATISSIQWINPESANGYAQATLVYADGTTAKKTVYSIDRDANGIVVGNEVLTYTAFRGEYSKGSVSANYAYNNESGESYLGVHLFEVTEGANGVVTLKQIQKPVTGATVTQGQTTITGTNGPVYVDNSTQILVRTTVSGSYVYTPYTGYSNMPSLTDATVYAVSTDSDAAAEYVYMYGTAATSTSEIVVYVDSLSYAEYTTLPGYVVLKDAYVNGVRTDVIVNDAWVDGVGLELTVGHVYRMYDATGDGVYDATAGDTVTDITTSAGAVTLNTPNTSAIYLKDYTVLTDAIQDTTTTVNYATVGATVDNRSDNSLLGNANTGVVLVYNSTTNVVSTIIVIDEV